MGDDRAACRCCCARGAGAAIAFTSRQGGVSGGSFASLNLGFATADDAAARGREPPARARGRGRRRRARREPAPAARQRRRRGRRGRPAAIWTPATAWPEGDALVTGEPGLPLIAHGADCLTAALVAAGGERAGGRARGLARARRGRARGCGRARRAGLRGRRRARRRRAAATRSARTSPGRCARASATTSSRTAGPISRRLRAPRARSARERPRSSRRRPVHDLRSGALPLAPARRRRQRAAGRDRATSRAGARERRARRRAGEPRARARGAWPRRRRARAAPPDAVELLAAVKYVEPADLAVLADAGIELVGENRVEQLLAKQAVAGERFTWDFIGHLQSRKARDLVGRVRLVHSLSTLSAAERLDRASEQPVACLVEVNAAGEESKQGLAPGRARRVPRGGRRRCPTCASRGS